MSHKQSLLLLAKIALSGILLWLVLARIDATNIIACIRTAKPLWLAPMLLAAPLTVVLSAWRWQILGLGLLGFWEAVRYTWIGLFFGSILPGMVGGDLAKGVSLAAKTPGARDVRLPVSIVVDKLIGFWALLFVFDLVALSLLGTMPHLLAGFRNLIWLTLSGTALGLLCAIAIWHPRGAEACEMFGTRLPVAALRALATRLLAAITSYRGQGAVLANAAIISVSLHSLNAVIYWLVLRSLAIPASLLFAAVFYCLLSVLLALPVSISGIGVRDVFAAGLFTTFGFRAEAGVAFSWLLLALSVPGIVAGGLIQVWEIFHRRHSH